LLDDVASRQFRVAPSFEDNARLAQPVMGLHCFPAQSFAALTDQMTGRVKSRVHHAMG
jgi:hypothetical protein